MSQDRLLVAVLYRGILKVEPKEPFEIPSVLPTLPGISSGSKTMQILKEAHRSK